MNYGAAPLAPPQRSIADFMATAFADDDRALAKATDDLERDLRSRLRAFWRNFDHDLTEWSDPDFDAPDEWWEERIDRFEEAEDEIVAIVQAFDHAFKRIIERWDLSEADRDAELERSRQAFVPVVLKLAQACRQAREQLIGLYGKKRAGCGVDQASESAEDIDRLFAEMGF